MRSRVYPASVHVDAAVLQIIADNAITDAGNALMDGDGDGANVALGRAQMALALCSGFADETELDRQLDSALDYARDCVRCCEDEED